MRLFSSCPLLFLWFVNASGFQIPRTSRRLVRPRLLLSLEDISTTTVSGAPKTTTAQKQKRKVTLGLITFDLDDTLYPIAPVIEEANAAFATAMLEYGFEGIEPDDIVQASKEIREEITKTQGPEASMVLTHTEIRELAIRREMEKVIVKRKLKQTADDWATPVSSLSPLIVKNAKKWASEAVSPSIVQAVLNAWEMERHHAAERNLYPECIDVLEQIKHAYPNVIIGAVTDGKANPLFMTFTLRKYFDFCLSWEDDQKERTNFFKELSSVEGNADLKWIYNAALEKYKELSKADMGMHTKPNTPNTNENDNDEGFLWIHVGDDLAYDVGGAAQCGAKTILVELEKQKYGQTARFRFPTTEEEENDNNTDHPQPKWSTTSDEELRKRKIMNDKALEVLDKKIEFLTRLPDAIDEIVEEETLKLQQQQQQQQQQA